MPTAKITDIKKALKLDASRLLRILVAGAGLNLRPSGYEPDELPDCSIPRQLTHFILNHFSGSTEGRVLPSSILGCKPAELPDCSIPRQHFRGYPLKRVGIIRICRLLSKLI